MSKSIKKQNNKRKKAKKRKDQLNKRNHIPRNKLCSGKYLGWRPPQEIFNLNFAAL